MMSVRLALSIFCFLLIVAQAGAQPAEDKTWLAHYRNVEGYWQSEEGRLQALRDASSLGLLQYKTELESLGWEVDGMLDSLERLNLATKGSPLVKSLTQINNGFQVTGAMLSLSQLFNSIWYDDPALYQGAYIPEAAREPLKDMCFVLMSTTLSEDGTLYNLLGNTTISAATRQAFWVTQAVDLTLKAGNYLLVQPFFDTYERMWWETYRDYFLNGPGALSVGEWFALCQEGSNSQGFATTYRTHMAGFWENSNDREHFVEYWADTGNWEQSLARHPDDAELSKLAASPGKLPHLRGLHHNPDRAERLFRDRFMARFFKEHLYKRLTDEARKILLAEREQLQARLTRQKSQTLASLEKASSLGELTVIVRDSQQRPLSGARVMVSYGRAPLTRSTVTDPAGIGTLGLPPACEGEVQVELAGHFAAQQSFRLQPDADSKARLDFQLKRERKPLDVSLQASPAELAYGEQLTVTAGINPPSAGLSTRWSLDGKELDKHAGRTSIAGVIKEKPGAHVFRIVVTDSEGVSGEAETTVLVKETPLKLSLSASEMRAEQPARVTATVAGGVPPYIYRFNLDGSTMKEQGPVNDTSSAVEVAVTAEPKTLTVNVHDSLGRQVTASKPIQAAGAVVEILVAADHEGRRVFLDGVKVKAVVDGRTEAVGYTGPDGSLNLAVASGSRVALRFFKENYYLKEKSREIKDGKAEARVLLQPAGTLKIKVVDKAGGKPIKGAVVTFDGESHTVDGGGNLGLTLPAGERSSLSVKAKGYVPREAKGTVAFGEVKEFVWQLDAEPASSPTPALAQPTAGTREWDGQWEVGCHSHIHFHKAPIGGIVEMKGGRFQGTFHIETEEVMSVRGMARTVADLSVQGEVRDSDGAVFATYRLVEVTTDKSMLAGKVRGTTTIRILEEGTLEGGKLHKGRWDGRYEIRGNWGGRRSLTTSSVGEGPNERSEEPAIGMWLRKPEQ